jgi:hypothetical protein
VWSQNSQVPSAEETGVSGISPKSSFDDVRESWLEVDALLALLSPDSERLSVGGGLRGAEYIVMVVDYNSLLQ